MTEEASDRKAEEPAETPAADTPDESEAEAGLDPGAESPEEPEAEAGSDEPAAEARSDPGAEAEEQPAADSPPESEIESPEEPSAESPEEPAAAAGSDPGAEAEEQPGAESPLESEIESSEEPAADSPPELEPEAAAESSEDAVAEVEPPAPDDPDRARAERYAALLAEAPTMTEAQYRKRSRRSFLTGGVAAALGYMGWRTLQGRPEDNRIPDVLRTGHEANEALWRVLSSDQRLAPTFDRSESSMIRVNGRHGIREEVDLDRWELTVLGPDGSTLGTHTMDDILALPKVELTVEHKCVEGWSHIVTWGGTPFSNFAALYADQLGSELTDFVSMVTPNREYYVGLDMPSMRNPQMLLAYELQGEPLTSEHGAPLRLATPSKYGIKCIKRIGTIEFTNEQPTDFWFERGYDWYAQL